MADVFISYAHADRDLARRIAAGLIAAGATVWWDRELVAGDDFDDTILREVTAAKCVIVVWTQSSVRSNYVRDEAQVALDAAKLIPVAVQGIDPPLGFRRVHVLHIGADGAEAAEFVRSLRRAVEERIDSTLQPPEPPTALRPPEVPPVNHIVVALDSPLDTIAFGAGCVWLGAPDHIEARDLHSGNVLGRSRAGAVALLSSADGESVVAFGFGIGYHSPDTIRASRLRLKRSLEETRKLNQSAGEDPGDWWSRRDQNIESTLRDAIEESDLLHTWAWQPGALDQSEDGRWIAIFVDEPDKRIQIWDSQAPDAPASFIPLGDHHPVEFTLLTPDALAMLERRGKQQIPRISLWRVSDGKCVAEHDLEYRNVNTICRAGKHSQVALGLDQSVALFDLDNGTFDAQVELESRPVRRLRFDPQTRRIGAVTDKQVVVIDTEPMRITESLSHGYPKGVSCDLRGANIAALVGSAENNQVKRALVLLRHRRDR